MTFFRSVGARLALALLTVVVGVLAIVYLIIVPSYQRSLENAELSSLSRTMTRSASASLLPTLRNGISCP